MNRLKFLLFAVVAVGLWSAQLALVSPGVSARGVELASASAQGAPAAVALKLEALRSGLLGAALKVAASPAARQKPGKAEGPAAEKVAALRAAALEALGDGVKAQLLVGAVNELGSLVAVGEGEPAAAPEGLDATAAGGAGSAGAVQNVAGAAYLLFSVPLLTVDKSEVSTVGQAFVGLPLAVDAGALDQISRDLGLVAVGLAAGGNMVAVGGLDKKSLETLLKSGKLGQVSMLGLGSVSELGPLKLPAFTAGDPMGGQAALAVGFRRDIAGTPFEVLAVASTKGVQTALADLQKFTVLALLGLLLLTVVVALLIGNVVEEEAPAVVAPQMARPKTNPPEAAAAAAGPPAAFEAEPPAPEPFAMGDLPAHHEASPDDFQFGGEASAASAPPVPDAETPFEPPPGGTTDANQLPPEPAMSADPFAALNAQQDFGPPVSDYSSDMGQRTVAYPVPPNLGAEAAPTGSPLIDAPRPMMMGDPDFNPDQTRVSAVPKELLKASQRISQEVTAVNPKMLAAAMPRVSPMGAGGDETHWQEVFRDFVAMREKCGEPADGLTYDKFSTKLRKNKEQLVAKYNCRTVRFQVHAKDGKAALKATPVRD